MPIINKAQALIILIVIALSFVDVLYQQNRGKQIAQMQFDQINNRQDIVINKLIRGLNCNVLISPSDRYGDFAEFERNQCIEYQLNRAE